MWFDIIWMPKCNFFMSRRNNTFWSKVDEMRVDEMRVGEMRVGESGVGKSGVGEQVPILCNSVC